MRRAFTVLATAAVAVAGFAAPAAAQTTALPLCTPNDGYVPGESCALVIATPECLNGNPVLDYEVSPVAVAGGQNTVDIRWTNLPGADVLQEDRPLRGDNVAWAAGADANVTLVFSTSPQPISLNVTAAAACSESLVLAASDSSSRSGAARSQSASGVLAATGSEALPLALGGGALILGGAALVLARRSRQTGA
jgi:LPXTG-motif cell wall-anchored protein